MVLDITKKTKGKEKENQAPHLNMVDGRRRLVCSIVVVSKKQSEGKEDYLRRHKFSSYIQTSCMVLKISGMTRDDFWRPNRKIKGSSS